MFTCKLSNIKRYYNAEYYTDDSGIRSVMTRTRFSALLENFHFVDNQRGREWCRYYCKTRYLFKLNLHHRKKKKERKNKSKNNRV